MGKGDRKTTKGKRFNSSYGNSRRHRRPAYKGSAVPSEPVVAVKKAVAKAPAKKAVVKKAAAKA